MGLVGDFFRSLRDDHEALQDRLAYPEDDLEDRPPNTPRHERPHVVVLVHGIRTWARWMEGVAGALEADPTIRVVKPKYGRFNLARFLLPTDIFARAAIRQVEQTIRTAQEHDAERISVIAHSFGTYIVAHLLMKDHFLRLHRLILCGCIMKRDFEWIQFHHKVGPDKCNVPHVINEYSDRDRWPARANRVTWVYGDAGTRGFNDDSYVVNRRHEFEHSGCLNADFAKRFWLPFLTSGTVVDP